MDNRLNIYECRRWTDVDDIWETWSGAVIVAAINEWQAKRIAEQKNPEEIEQIVQWPLVWAAGEPRILYDDYQR